MTDTAGGRLRVGGLEPYSTCDFPGNLASVVFLQGCSWRCRYCHNPELRSVANGNTSPWESVVGFLKTRVGLLDAVVFSGGEPLMQSALPDAIEEVRALGFRIGLHTSGAAPERFEVVLPLVDWVGFDVKAPFEEYERITGTPDSGRKARESLTMLIASAVPYQVRTTVHPKLLDDAAVARIDAELAGMGIGPTKVQAFRALGCIDAELLGP